MQEATALLCTESGNFTAWQNCLSSHDAKTATHHVPGGRVTAFAACSLTSQGFAAAAATEQGAVHLIFSAPGTSLVTGCLDTDAGPSEVRHYAAACLTAALSGQTLSRATCWDA